MKHPLNSGKLLAFQRDLAIALSAAKDLKIGLRLCFDAAISASGMDCGGIYLYGSSSGALDMVYHKGLSSEFVKEISHYEPDSPNAQIVNQGKCLYQNYAKIAAKTGHGSQKEKLLASAIIPIKYGDEIIGCLNIASHKLKTIDRGARVILETIAAHIGGALARLRAESALKDSEKKIKSVFNFSPDSITLISPEGFIIDSNPAALKLLGYPPDAEIRGLSIFRFILENERIKVLENIEKALKYGTVHNLELNIVKIDGTVFPTEISGGVVMDSKNTPSAIIVITKDISERRRTENELRNNENRFRTIFEKSGDAIFLTDANGNFLEVNDFTCQELGYTKDDLLKMNMGDVIEPEDLKSQPLRMTDLAIGMTFISKRNLVRKDGAIIQAEITIRKLPDSTVIGIGRDVTQQRKYEQKIAMQARMLDSVQQSVVALDSHGKIVYWNEYSEKLLGYTKDEALNQSASFCLSIKDSAKLYHTVLRKFRRGQSWSGELIINSKQGTLIPVFITCSPIFENNNLIGSIDVAFDIRESKRAEDKLRLSEEKYRLTFENIGATTITINQSKIITMANNEFEKLTGYSRNEVLNKMAWTEFIVPEDLIKMLEQDKLRQKDSNSALRQYEFRLVTKSGQIKNIFLTVDLIPGTTDKIASLIDITQRIKTEEALRLSEKKFAAAFKENPAALAITRVSDGNIIECNESVKSLLGYEIEEVVGKTALELNIWVNEDDRARMIANLKFGDPVHNWEVQFRAKDGSIKICQYSAQILTLNKEQFILATFIDLTEMKRAQEALIESKLRYQELFESLLEGVALLDESGRVVFCNPAFINIHEAVSMEQLIGKDIREFLADTEMESNYNSAELWRKGINTQLEVEINTIKGNRKTIIASGTPRLDNHNNLGSVIVAIIDITESKRLREFASYAQRLEAAGKIAGQVAHDFNNLLAPMVAYPELIKAAIPEDGFVLGMVNDIETAAKAMADINQQLLTLSRRGHYNLEIINLNDIINQAINQTSHSLDEIEVITDFEPELMNIKGGSAQILRIISNLINNALDAMHDKGRLTIKTENYYLDRRAGITGIIPRGEYSKVSISDTGCGIAEDVIPKIFDTFFTTKIADKKRGSGLGLSVVHAVMEDHQGFVDLESKVNIGTTFYLYFPITRDTVDTPSTNEIKGGSESILIIDDDKLQRNVNSNLLNRLGYQIATAESGEMALSILKNKTFDLLIVDMIMPGGIDGTETYRKALEINPNQKALIISGFAETDRVKEANLLGAGGFLRKPLSMKVLAIAIRAELDKKAGKSKPLPSSAAAIS